MLYRSTRGAPGIPLSQAIEQGLAPDGGLYVPERFPQLDLRHFSPNPLSEFAARFLAPFFEGDKLAPKLNTICNRALSFPIPLTEVNSTTAMLELFHGPTAAFKDVGARFLAECFADLGCAGERTILVATSGDTGGAVAAAFHKQPGLQVIVLFPKNGVSPLQKHQLTCWGDNVRAVAVNGTFDDCQRLVKEAFTQSRQTSSWSKLGLTSANSINVGRLLPQAVYYASASLQWQQTHGTAPGFVIPSGNIGNATAALWAKKSGTPIAQIVLATNANRVVPDYLQTGIFKAATAINTLANAMDVGNPSNIERILSLYPNVQALQQDVQAASVTDDQIRSTIRDAHSQHGLTLCPHTATAFYVRGKLSKGPWILVATASPAKFTEVVTPLVGQAPTPPPALQALLGRPTHSVESEPTLKALEQALAKS